MSQLLLAEKQIHCIRIHFMAQLDQYNNVIRLFFSWTPKDALEGTGWYSLVQTYVNASNAVERRPMQVPHISSPPLFSGSIC